MTHEEQLNRDVIAMLAVELRDQIDTMSRDLEGVPASRAAALVYAIDRLNGNPPAN